MTGVDDLIRLLNAERIGRSVSIDVIRLGRLRRFDITPVERDFAALQIVDYGTSFSPAAKRFDLET